MAGGLWRKNNFPSFCVFLYFPCCCSLVAKSCPTLCEPMDCSPPGFSIHAWISQAEYWSGLPFPSPGDLPNPRIGPTSPTLATRFFATQSPAAAAAAAKSLQPCLTLCDPIDISPPGSPIPGILQARTQEWVAISFSSAWKWKVKGNSLSHIRLLVTPWTAAYQAPPSMGFSRQEFWSGVPLPSLKTGLFFPIF